MDRKRLVLATVALVGLWALTPALAQSPSPSSEGQKGAHYHGQQQREPSRSLADRLDEFGRALFGGAPPRQSGRSSHGPGAAAVRRGPTTPVSPQVAPKSTLQDPITPPEQELVVPPAEDATGTEPPDNEGQPSAPATSKLAAPRDSKVHPKHSPARPSGPGISPDPLAGALGPLHERLRAFRDSAFGQSQAALPRTGNPPAPEAPKASEVGASDPPASARQALPVRARPSGPSRDRTPAPTRSPETAGGGLKNPASVHPKDPEAAALQRAVAERFADQRTARETTRQAAAPKSKTPTLAGPASEPPATGVKEPASAAGKATDSAEPEEGDVLFLRQSPILSVETQGPRRITVGKESAYEVTIHNSGQVAANELAVTVELPEWADVLGAEVSTGATQSPGSAGRNGAFLWKVGRLDAKTREKLVLRIVPRQSRPFELGVKWSFTPVRSQAEIEVQESKLALELEGPREVLHGRKEVYKLKLSNTGNGPAENLLVKLTPIGPGENVSASHKLGTLAAGQRKVIEVELTARHAGDLTVQVQVDGDGGAHAELNEKVVVRRAALSVTVEGPKTQFVGTAATFQIRLSNTGTAPARNVKVAATVPEGAEQLSAMQDGRISPDRKKIHWTLAELAPGAQQTLLVQCDLGQPGPSRLEVQASADDNLTASGAVATAVEAIADLVLSVADPAGPVPVGQETTYQVRIRNRGTKAAQNVEAVGYFSHGIEPASAEGAAHKIAPGQVVFGPIPSIGAGQTHVLDIRAKAVTSGNHIFRAEVYCRSLGARLVSEETTRFYDGGPASTQTSVAQPERRKPAAADPSPRTAERRLGIEPIRSSQRPSPDAEKKR